MHMVSGEPGRGRGRSRGGWRLWLVLAAFAALAGGAPDRNPAAISIDYPEDGAIFPPEITAPTFLWRDPSRAASWRIAISFPAGAPIEAVSRGERMSLGAIDPECSNAANEPPRLTPEQTAAHSWTPAPALWDAIKKRSVVGAATITITGIAPGPPATQLSRGQAAFRTSRDPVGAPIFYRDVPLMPSETEKGVIKPLSAAALPLVAWRLRNLAEPRSRVVMHDIPVCANCHSFSADGKTLGLDLDGLENNKGRYALTPVAPRISIGRENEIQWSTAEGRLSSAIRAGFMSQVSPDGQYVVTTIDSERTEPSNYYVANFRDYRFLQVFYPTRGALAWYSRATGTLRELPGAEDPRYVQMGGVWSPDGSYLVFARAEARDPNPQGVRALFANDPNELQIRYDLYRIAFNGGQGGKPEPIAGASANGMSNSFPKISPDGKWIVFVKARNGLLMRPDSELWIVPAAGGESRRLRANAAPVDSWHSFSPNGRWLAFSSKRAGPYTKLYLTHIDAGGADSPAILVPNATASNRAVNLPEFVNVPPDGLRWIGGPVIDYYRLVDSATYQLKHGHAAQSIPLLRQALSIDDRDESTHRGLASALLQTGSAADAAAHIRKADEIKLSKAVAATPASASVRNELGALLLQAGRADEAAVQLRAALAIDPNSAPARTNLGAALLAQGRAADALSELRQAVAADPKFAPARYQLGRACERLGDPSGAAESWNKSIELDPKLAEAHASLAAALYATGNAAAALSHWRAAVELVPSDAMALRALAWALATAADPTLRNGAEAQSLAVRAVELTGGKNAADFDALATAYAERGRFADAAATARRALAMAEQSNQPALAEAIKRRIALYDADKPFRDAAHIGQFAAPVAP